MNIKIIVISLCGISIFCTACKVYTPQSMTDERLHIINHSDRSIYAYFCLNDPDTSIVNNINEPVDFPVKQGKDQSFPRCIILNKSGSWDSFFKEKNETYRIHIFVFDANVIDNVSWKEVKKEYLILKRFDLSYKDLQQHKWDVIFQGN